MIFISFASEDADLARALGLRMEAAGAEVWCSVFTEKLADGRPWRDQVYAALDRSSVFVLLVTGSPINGMTKEESDYALDLFNKHESLRFVTLRNAQRVTLPPAYRRFQAVDLPPDWDAPGSQFLSKKLRQWGEVVDPDGGQAPTPEPTPDVSQQIADHTPKPIPRDEPPAESTRTAAPTSPTESGSSSAQTSIASSDASSSSPGRGSGPRQRRFQWIAVVGLLALTVWGGLKFFGEGKDSRDPAIASVDRDATQAAGRSAGAEQSTPVAVAPVSGRTSGDQLLDMVRIPAGKFLMGRASSPRADEKPQRERTLAAFELAKTEVTRGHWLAVMSKPPIWAQWGDSNADAELPATELTWDEAKEFCDRLSAREGLKGTKGYRLPSEAEWEYACRAGTTTEYWSGDSEEDLARVGWYSQNSDGQVHAVGEKPENPWGLFDMHGNVWEWCEDTWHSDYQTAPTDGSAWVDEASSARVIRGGSFEDPAGRARSAARTGPPRSSRWDDAGFRPARSVTTD